MLPVAEINALIEQLKRADELIDAQKSRIEFLSDSGEDVTEFQTNLSRAIEKRNRMEEALKKQVAKHGIGAGASSAAKSSTDRRSS